VVGGTLFAEGISLAFANREAPRSLLRSYLAKLAAREPAAAAGASIELGRSRFAGVRTRGVR
jgi:hypothetical protein